MELNEPRRRKDRNMASKPTPTDVSIMGTNDSSIVSKRSVEKLYHAEPHFFHHFVKKPKRRAPLINRGYWLRMRAIEYELMKYLGAPKRKQRKVVVNLGCGYDPLPFQILSKHPEETQDVLFIDVDYPDLIANKVEMIKAADEIVTMLPNLQLQPGDAEPACDQGSDAQAVANEQSTSPTKKAAAAKLPSAATTPLLSKNYAAVGCDLSKTQLLQSTLEGLLDLQESSFCFVAEVSITYMKEKAADALIKWAGSLGDARFIQLEQCLPYGEYHPFAETMLKHFHKFGTRLRSLQNYPTEQHQRERFRSRGWNSARSKSLWKLWSSSEFLDLEEKRFLDDSEPFDEWEEFALFGSHYFILTAETGDAAQNESSPQSSSVAGKLARPLFQENVFRMTRRGPVLTPRSFAASFSHNTGCIALHGGRGSQIRLRSADLLVEPVGTPMNIIPETGAQIGERLCHTISTLVNGDRPASHLLVGGRTSPDAALSDCWLLKPTKASRDVQQYIWLRTSSLPVGLYRHSATSLIDKASGTAHGVLIYGGKTDRSRISDKWYFWQNEDKALESGGRKWIELEVEGADCEPRFGCNLVLVRSTGPNSFSGALFGGMGYSGTILPDALAWTLDLRSMRLSTTQIVKPISPQIPRFGAAVVPWRDSGDRFALIGGVSDTFLEPEVVEAVVQLQINPDAGMSVQRYDASSSFSLKDCPLLVGHCANYVGDDRFLLSGGGATCFSFGAYHNSSPWMIQWQSSNQSWQVVEHDWQVPTSTCNGGEADDERSDNESQRSNAILHLGPEELNFEQILEISKPCVLTGLDMGTCISTWNIQSVKERIGPSREVIIHKSSSEAMDFQSKNFAYEKITFERFADEIEAGGRHYLRALSTEAGNKPANFWKDYPELAADFKLPEPLSRVIDLPLSNGQPRQHSSVFRISGPVAMWLHYDVMSNVLCQINGSKKLLLYPPEDVHYVQIPPGQSSSSLNMFDAETYKKHDLSRLHPYSVQLEPGDVLFIPALWMHTAQPTSGVSIAVNVFFRDLDSGYAAGRDVYGNRDLQAYEDGRRDVKRIEGRFAKLPTERRKFYLLQLAKEMKELAEKRDDSGSANTKR